MNIAQISVKGKKKTVGSDTVQKNATDKKNKAIAKIQNGTYLDKSSITLFQIAVDIQDEKLKNGDINENTYGRNLESIEYIKKILGENLKIQKATVEDIKKLLRSKRDEGKSQSDINKLYNIVNASFRKAVLDKIITTADTPMNYIDILISKKIKKEVIAFEVEEQIIIANNNPNNCEHLLFCKKDGTYIIPSQISQIFKRVCREAGVKTNLVTGCNTHMKKHTFVTRAFESGMSLLTISKLVGTSVRELEKTYAHVLDKFMKVELEGLRKHLKNNKIIAFPRAKNEAKSIS